MKRGTLTVFLCLIILFSAQAQHQGDSILYEYKQDQQEYFDSLRLVLEKDGYGMEGTGYKSFQSHLHVWEPLVFPQGDYRPAKEAREMAALSRGSIKNVALNWSWKELGPFNPPDGNHVRHLGVGRLTAIFFHPTDEKQMFVTSPTGGLYYSQDGGENWKNGGTDFLPTAAVGSIVIHPFKPGYWIVSTGDGDGDWTPSAGIYRTQDFGNTWEEINDGIFVPKTKWNALMITKLIMHPKNFNIIYAATNKGLYCCSNATSTKPIWQAVIEKEPFNDVEFKHGNPAVIYAAGEKIYHSQNGGRSWALMPSTTFTNIGYELTKVNLELTPADPNIVYAAVTGIQKKKGTYKAQLYRYDERTGVWEQKGRILDRSYMPYGLIPGRDKAFAISPTDANVLYASNVNPIVKSEDGGSTWVPQRSGMHDDIHHIVFAQAGAVMWACNDGGIYKSTDFGESWVNKSNGIGVANIHAISTSNSKSNKIVIGTYDTGSSIYDPATGEWTFSSGGDGYCNMIDHQNDSIVYTSAVGGTVWRSDDGRGEKKRTAHKRGSGSDWQTWMTMDPKNPKIIYQCGRELWRSNNRGASDSWESILNVPEQFPGYHRALRVYVAPEHPDVVYAVLLGKKPMKIVRTTQAFSDNVKETWEDIGHPENAWVIDLTIEDEDPLQFWLAYSKVGGGFYNKVWKYNGKRWIDLSYDIPEWTVVYSITHEKGSLERVYIGTNMGVYTTGGTTRGRRWTLLKGLPHCEVRQLVINYATRTLVAGTFGRGAWQCSLVK